MIIIFLLLRHRQRLIFHLQLQRFHNIFALAEPQNQLVTFTDTFLRHPRLIVESSQLIGPFFLILMGLVLVQNLDLILHTGAPFPIDLVLQDETALVVRSSLYKFPVQRDGLFKIVHLCTDFCHPIQQHPSHRRTVIGHIEDLHAFSIPLRFLIYFADHVQHVQVLHPPPVHRICDLRCSLIILFLYLCLYLLRFQAVFVLIQWIPSSFPLCFPTLPQSLSRPLPVLRLRYGMPHSMTAHLRASPDTPEILSQSLS